MKTWIQISVSKFRNRVKSAVHSSSQKLKILTDIHELTRKNFWSDRSFQKSEVFLYLRNKKPYKSRKEEKVLLFYYFFVHTNPVRTKKKLQILSTIQMKRY